MTNTTNQTDSSATSDDGYSYTFTEPKGWINLMNPGQSWAKWTREQGPPTTKGWKVFGTPAAQAPKDPSVFDIMAQQVKDDLRPAVEIMRSQAPQAATLSSTMLIDKLRRTLGNIKDATRLADVRSLANLGLGFLDAQGEAITASASGELGPSVPDHIITAIRTYGDFRADDDPSASAQLGEVIYALRRHYRAPASSREAAPMPKQWHERTETMDDRSCMAAMKAEIADLRAAVAQQGAQPDGDLPQTLVYDPKA